MSIVTRAIKKKRGNEPVEAEAQRVSHAGYSNHDIDHPALLFAATR